MDKILKFSGYALKCDFIPLVGQGSVISLLPYLVLMGASLSNNFMNSVGGNFSVSVLFA